MYCTNIEKFRSKINVSLGYSFSLHNWKVERFDANLGSEVRSGKWTVQSKHKSAIKSKSIDLGIDAMIIKADLQFR